MITKKSLKFKGHIDLFPSPNSPPKTEVFQNSVTCFSVLKPLLPISIFKKKVKIGNQTILIKVSQIGMPDIEHKNELW